MKKILLGITGMFLAVTINAQTKPTTGVKPAVKPAAAAKPTTKTIVKPAVKPAAAAKPTTKTIVKPAVKTTSNYKFQIDSAGFYLKTPEDSLSYAIGILDGNFFKTQGVTSVNPTSLALGFRDAMQGKAIFTPEQADQVLRGEMQKMMRKKIQPNIDQCNDFLTHNAKKPGVKQTASGLQYEVITEGTGARPADTSVVKVHYEGFLLNATRPFDSSRDRGAPAEFPLNGVIRGWTEGVQLMTVGSRYKFYIPYQLGYGEQGSGEAIPGGSLLIFDVELIEIVKSN
jgi:FKBP-type peptidyl-prolyl cis-trans isomerase